ncbi:hypothetical protein R0K04_25750, partial [Pseudoalteromonas sp. SIMBA_153]
LLPQDDSVVELVGYLFNKRSDERWLANIEKEKWDKLVELVRVEEKHLNLVATAKNSLRGLFVMIDFTVILTVMSDKIAFYKW